MSITRFSFRNYRFVLVLTLAALALGGVGYMKMPRQEDPTLSAFSGIITVIYPGASVDEIEEQIIEPLEEVVFALEEVELVEATARPGVGIINAEFREDSDKERAYDLLLQELSSVEPEFPDGVIDVRTFAGKPSNVAVLQLVLHGPGETRADLLRWAEELEGRLRPLPDAKEVALRGDLEEEIHVNVDPGRLAEAGLTLGQVHDALRAGEARIPGGAVTAGSRRLSVRTIPRYESVADIEATVLRTVEGRPVRLADVAVVERGLADPNYLVRRNGEPAISLTVTLKEGHNVFHLASDVEEVLEKFRADLPTEIEISVVANQSEDVRRRLHTFGGSLLQGGLIISFFVAVLAGWRPALAVVTALVLSVGISFSLLSWFGIALQQMSIAGLVVVLGLLVDNAIVVVESILQRRREGADPRTSAIEGTDRVAGAVASSTATTVAAFMPMLLMAGSVGEFTRDIPIVVCLVLVVSLFMALLITPLVAARSMGDGNEGRSLSPWFRRTIVEGTYRGIMERALLRPRRAVLVAFGLGLIPFLCAPFLGMNFFPRAEKSIFLVRVKAPEGTALTETAERSLQVEDWLLEQPEVIGVTANLGEGNPTVYYNQLRAAAATNFSEILVEIDRDRMQSLPDVARRARTTFADSPDFVVETKTFVQGPPIGLPVSVRLYGDDLGRLSRQADELASELREIPGAINIFNGLRAGPARLDLEVDPVLVDRLGLNGGFVAREVRLALAGGQAAELRRDGDDIAVIVRTTQEGDERIDDLERIRVPLPDGGSLPLAQLTRPMLAPTYAEISHTNLERSVIVGADVDGRLATEVMTELMPFVTSLEQDPQEAFEVIGEDEERDRAFLSMLTNVIVAVGLIYGILVLQFGSFLHPLLIFTSIPIAFGGSVAGLFLSGWSFGFTAFIGLLALTGIVVNNAIVLVDQINQLRREGEPLDVALIEGTTSRFQPILLTTITTIAGLIPLTLTGSSMWGPLGFVVIGGLVSSTVVTLLLVPTLYFLVERRNEEKSHSGRSMKPTQDEGTRTTRHESRSISETALASQSDPAAEELSSHRRSGRRSSVRPSGLAKGLTVFAMVVGLFTSHASASATPTEKPLSLSDLSQLIESGNPELAAAQFDHLAAEARARAAASTRWPALQVTGAWEVTNDPSETFGLSLLQGANPLTADLDQPVDVVRGEVAARWVLWDRGRNSLIGSARAGADAAGAAREANQAALELAAAELFFGLVQARDAVAVQDAAYEQLQQEAEDAAARLDVGRTTEADVLGLRARAAEVLSARSAAEESVARFNAQLLRLFGNEEFVAFQPSLDEAVPPTPFSDLNSAIAASIHNRPELGASASGVRAATLERKARSSLRWPKLVGSAGYSGLAPERDWELESRSYAASVSVEWNPFRGGGIGAEVDEAEAALGRRESEHLGTRGDIAREVSDAWHRVQAAEAQLAAAEAGDAAANEAFRIVELRFREGRDTLARYLEAERSRTAAANRQVAARSALQSARARLRWACGLTVLG